MTIGVSALFNGTNNLGQQNGDEQGHYKSVLKQQKAHDRTIIGLEVFRDPRTGQVSLVSIGHDCLKIWSIIAFDDEFELAPLRQVTRWNCGVQSYAVSDGGKAFYIVGTESILYNVRLNVMDTVVDDEPQLPDLQRGLMEIWFVQSTRTPNQFLTVNFQSNQLQILEATGELISAVPIEKARQISTIVYGPRFTAIGNSMGVVSAVSSSSLQSLYSIEAHSMKVRCLSFVGADEDGKLLSGSDDKTVKLFALSETRAQLLRIFCGHKGIITGLSVCGASAGERFASCGTDNAVILWDAQTGDKLHEFRKCTGAMNDVPRCVRFTPNGRFLVVGTDEAHILSFRVPQPKNYVEEPPLEQLRKPEEEGRAEEEGKEEEEEWRRREEEEEHQGGGMNEPRESMSMDLGWQMDGEGEDNDENVLIGGRDEDEEEEGEQDEGREEMPGEGGDEQERMEEEEEAGGGGGRGGSSSPHREKGDQAPPHMGREGEETERRELEMELGID